MGADYDAEESQTVFESVSRSVSQSVSQLPVEA